MSNNDELIAQFIEISGGEEESIARFYLSSSNWSLEDALENFLHYQNTGEAPTPPPAGNSAAPTPAAPVREEAAARETGSAGNFKKTAGSKPKFATLSDMSKRGSSDEEGQAFYAGGSERSGQQVLGPPKRKDFREQLNEMFRMAQEHSASSNEANPAPSTSTGVTWGQGMRLGMTDSDHAAVGTPQNKEGKKPVVILKLWSQGFSIDDGELRAYDDPANKEFLETVTRGEIPTELLEMGWMVNVDVEDHRHEEYKRVALPTFKGSGHTLGSPVPNVECDKPSNQKATAAPVTTPNVSEPANVTEALAREQLKLDTSAETTTLQIRLADGTRLAAQFNLTHRVADILQYIRNARPQYASRDFLLVTSFPTRELKDAEVTIAAANLKNAAIMQRLI